MRKEQLDHVENLKNKNQLSEGILNNYEHLTSWLAGLTDLEQKVLSVLFQFPQALTIKKIRAMIISSTFLALQYPNKDTRYTYGYPFKSYYSASKELQDEAKSWQDDEAYELIEKKMKFPSFRRLDKTVQDLVNLRILIPRNSNDLEDKKVKGLYFLNPIIRTQLQRKKEEELDKIQQRKIEHRRHVDKINAELIKSGSGITMNY